jgi:hypothetical protein
LPGKRRKRKVTEEEEPLKVVITEQAVNGSDIEGSLNVYGRGSQFQMMCLVASARGQIERFIKNSGWDEGPSSSCFGAIEMAIRKIEEKREKV